jgi:hypothetical protein
MTPERAIWLVILAPLCLILALALAIGPGPVNAAFEAVFDGIAWVVLVWLAMLGLV